MSGAVDLLARAPASIPPAALSAEAADALGIGLPDPDRAYQQMVLIRTVEERLLQLFAEGAIGGTTHTSIGQEANAVGIMAAIDRNRDIVWSNHRCHGHFLAYCGKVEALVSEIMGRTTGVCQGRGGSQHLCYRNFHSNGIQGGIAPVAVGTALARKEEGAVALVFLGDGTMGEGMVYESLNLAMLLRAPILFVVEDNGIAQTTPSQLGVAGSITDRARPFGLETHFLDEQDPLAIEAVATAMLAEIRRSARPAWLHIRTERIGPHSKGDDTRPDWRIAEARAKDPLALFRPRVADPGRIEQACSAIVEQAIQSALVAPLARG